MSLSIQEPDDESQFIMVAKIDNAKNISQLLKAVNLRETATVIGSENGLKVTVEDSKCVQANAFIQSDIFQEFVIREEPVIFKINLSVLIDCISIFGNSSVSGVTPALKMCYAGHGSPLILVLEEGGVLTDCTVKTLESEELLDFDFCGDNVVNKIIMKADCVREVFADLDPSSDVLEIIMSPDPPYFRLATFGMSGSNYVDFGRDSEVLESFQCTATASHRYRLSMLRLSTKPLSLAKKVSFRIDDRGILCLQYMITTDDQHICFVEFYCCPVEDDGEER